MRKQAALAAAAVSVVLAGCSSSITEPAAPATPMTPSPRATASEAPATPTPAPARNPYETGAERGWAIEPSAEPTAVVFDRQSRTAIAVVQGHAGTTLEAFNITSSGRTAPAWTYDVADGGLVGAIDAASGRVYVQVGAKPDDLVVLNARTGAEQTRWTRAHVLDPDVPALVGAYDTGGGIAKLSRDSILTAIINDAGEAINDERLFMFDSSSDELTIGHNIVNTNLRSRAGNAFVTFPELSVVSGEECWTVSDGIVCIAADSGKHTVAEYDPRGGTLKVHDVDAGAAALTYQPVAFDADVTASELAEALADKVGESGGETADGETAGEAADGGEATGDGEATGEAAGEENAEPDGEPAGDAPAERIPAILHDGTWVTDLPQASEGAEVVPIERGAPFVLVGKQLVNAAVGEVLTVDGSPAEQSAFLVGSGHSFDMFFEWDGAALHYLEPVG
ncbi:prolipoprotein diacylglyceryl transferase [Trueperella bialowiezensis]|uniref:PQQ enzyme repeat n=1 Tax=Trueperella bialowiezensis TaxID=312285 RepID=A0A3S4X5T7_9ACTO|nr:hypothetical protein [Trueperella bialowiezensis]VEI13294.1 Uncharacterised protein [Trueperella bialowiezensis]